MNQGAGIQAAPGAKPVTSPDSSWQTDPIGRAEQHAIYKLWDSLSDFDAAGSDRALDLFLKQICRWIGAENAFWIGAIRIQRGTKAKRDPMSGWRAGAIHMLDSAYVDKKRQKSSLRAINSQDSDPGETSRAIARQSGRFRVVTLSSGEAVRSWRSTVR